MPGKKKNNYNSNHDNSHCDIMKTKLQGLAKSGAGFQRAEDSSAEHIAQVSNLIFDHCYDDLNEVDDDACSGAREQQRSTKLVEGQAEKHQMCHKQR